jgi:hypothetical protein
VGTFQVAALRDGLPDARSAAISLDHSSANSTATAIRNQAAVGIARAAKRVLTASDGTADRAPTREKADRPSTATHTGNSGPNRTENA